MNEPQTSAEVSLIRLIQIFASLSLGAMAAFLVSIRDVTPRLRLEFSWWSPVAFAAALGFSWLFWRLVFQPADTGSSGPDLPGRQRGRAIRFALLSVILCLATLAAFGLSLKGISNERIREIIQGAAIAVLALSFLGWMLWRIARFLDLDSHRGSETRDEAPDSGASAAAVDKAGKR